MTIAVLGPGGVGGLLAGALDRAGSEVVVVARESTAEVIARQGVSVQSVIFGDFVAHPRALARLEEPVWALIVATKARGLEAALQRIAVEPEIVLPLLNGLDHLAVLRERFAPPSVLAGSIRVEADRPRPGAVVHTSRFLLVSMASAYPAAQPAMQSLADALVQAQVPVKIGDSEAQVMWSKLVRLNALACVTSRDCALSWWGRSRRPPRSPSPREHRMWMRRRRSPSWTRRMRRSEALCSATSPPGANRSSTRSPDRCCARRHATASPVRRLSG